MDNLFMYKISLSYEFEMQDFTLIYNAYSKRCG